MKYQVLVVAEAEEDIFDIYRYVLQRGVAGLTICSDGSSKLAKAWPSYPFGATARLSLGVSAYTPSEKSISSLTGSSIRSREERFSFIAFWMGAGPCRRSWSATYSVSPRRRRL